MENIKKIFTQIRKFSFLSGIMALKKFDSKRIFGLALR